MYQEALSRQLALDYCCSPADVADSKNHFTIYVPQEGRRRFQEQTVCRLKIAVVNGKLLVTGSEEIVAECRKRYADVTGEWFFDMKRLRELEELLAPFGLRIAQVHPFFLPESGGIASSDPPSALLSDARDFELIRYDQDAILQFRGDDRFDQAFAFDPDAPDVLGMAAVKDDEILGMAGADWDQCSSPRQRNACGIDFSKTSGSGYFGSGYDSLLWNKHVPHCFPTGSTPRRLRCGMGRTDYGRNKVN